MTRPLYISSSAIAASRVPDVVDECVRRGLRRLELTSSFRYYDGIRADVIAAKANGMDLLLHNYFPPPPRAFVINLASSDPDILGRSFDHCCDALQLSAEVGAPHFSVHAGFALDPRPAELGGRLNPMGGRTRRDAAATFFETVARLCEVAEKCEVDLLIENNVISRSNTVDGRNELLLCVTAEDILELFDAVRHPRLGLLLDMAHVKVSTAALGLDRDQTVSAIRHHVRAVHLSDNDGTVDDNWSFDGSAWFLPHLAEFPAATCVIETRPFDEAILATCIAVVEAARSRNLLTRPTTEENSSCW